MNFIMLFFLNIIVLRFKLLVFIIDLVIKILRYMNIMIMLFYFFITVIVLFMKYYYIDFLRVIFFSE